MSHSHDLKFWKFLESVSTGLEIEPLKNWQFLCALCGKWILNLTFTLPLIKRWCMFVMLRKNKCSFCHI